MKTVVLETTASLEQVRATASEWLHNPVVRRNARQPQFVAIQSLSLEGLSDRYLRDTAATFGLPLRQILECAPFQDVPAHAHEPMNVR